MKHIIVMILMTALLLVALVYSPPAPLSYDRTLVNLASFARLYGYVRYFHPSDEAARVDWQDFVIRGVKEVENATSARELKEILQRLFLPVAPSVLIYSRGEEAVFNAMSLTPPGQDSLKTVSWQHYGLKTGEDTPLFNSVRVNRTGRGDTGWFGNLMGKIDAPPYRNRRFILRAAVKVVEGEARLWFRVDRDYGVRGFYRDNKNNPVTPGDWETVEITGKIDRDAFMLNMGLLVKGKGAAYLDDIQLLMEDQGKFVPVNIRNSGFEKDEPGKKPKYWLPQLKDFQCLVSADESFGGKHSAFITNLEPRGPDRLFDPVLKAGEYIRKELGGDLFCVVPLVLYAKKGRTFPEAVSGKSSLKTIPADKYGERHKRLAAVVIAWNALRHFYPYWDAVSADWNRLLIRGLDAARKSRDQWTFLCDLRHMVAGLKDGQAQVYHPVVKTRAGFPFALDWIENRVVITASKDKSFRRGDVLLSIDGVGANKLMAREQDFLSGSVRWKRVRALDTFGWGPRDSRARITLSRKGHKMEVQAIRNHTTQVREFYRPGIFEIQGTQKNSIYYVNLSDLWRGEFDKWRKTLSAAAGIIFDARGPASLENRFIFAHLGTKSLRTPLYMVPRILYPDGWMVRFRDQHWTVAPREPLFKAKTVFLVDNGTVSGAEALAAMALTQDIAGVIGKRTAGAGGNINTMELPGNYRLIWTGSRVMNPDNSGLHLKGVQPHIHVERTIAGVRKGKDEVLEKALVFLTGNEKRIKK